MQDAATGVKSVVSGIASAYEDDEFVPDGYVKAAHILFLVDADAELKADTLKARIDSGEFSFGQAALLFSACPTRDLNGSLGIFPSLSRLQDGTIRGGSLPYDGKDTSTFDELIFGKETALNVIHKVNSIWGTHLVLVKARGGPPSTLDLVASATELVGQAMGSYSDGTTRRGRGANPKGGFGAPARPRAAPGGRRSTNNKRRKK